MKVLVTGGTGFVGREVMRQLEAVGHSVQLFTRRDAILAGDRVAATARECDALIHLVGIISEVGTQTFENVHVRLTEKIAALAKSAGVKRFVHMSALGTRAEAGSRYHQTKWAAEEIVRSSGLDWTIFRPSIIYGPGDGFVNMFARMTKFSPIVPLIGGGRTKFQPVSVANVARCFVASLTEAKSIGRVFDLCGDETFSLREIVQAVMEVTNRRRLKLSLPFAVARVQAAFAELLFARLFHKAPPLNRDQVTMLREDNVGDARAANELFRLRHERFGDEIARYLSK